MILPKNNLSLTNHHPSPVPTGSHLDASFMRWSKVELPSGKNPTTWNMNNFKYSKSRGKNHTTWNIKKQFRILKVLAAFAIKLWISGQTCPMKANFVFANLIFCLIWSNWDDQNSSFEPPYSFLSQGSKGEGEEGGGGPEGEGVQGGVQRALLPRVPVSSSRRCNCGSECLSVFLSEPEFQWVPMSSNECPSF